eukprot:3937855-Rhodomonas_salina.1
MVVSEESQNKNCTRTSKTSGRAYCWPSSGGPRPVRIAMLELVRSSLQNVMANQFTHLGANRTSRKRVRTTKEALRQEKQRMARNSEQQALPCWWV